jgi:hypothetical protein
VWQESSAAGECAVRPRPGFSSSAFGV